MLKLVVLLSTAALASASLLGPGLLAPGLGVHGLGWPGSLGAGLVAPGILGHGVLGHGILGHGLGAPTIYAPHGGSLPHGQPANVIGADGRPLDTIDVNVDRARHHTARIVAASQAHILKRRSLPLVAPLVHAPAAISHTSRIDIPGPVLLSAPIAPYGLGPIGHGPIGPWGPIGHGPIAPLGHIGHGPIAPWGLPAPLAHW